LVFFHLLGRGNQSELRGKWACQVECKVTCFPDKCNFYSRMRCRSFEVSGSHEILQKRGYSTCYYEASKKPDLILVFVCFSANMPSGHYHLLSGHSVFCCCVLKCVFKFVVRVIYCAVICTLIISILIFLYVHIAFFASLIPHCDTK
jgi:hypothetical protein